MKLKRRDLFLCIILTALSFFAVTHFDNKDLTKELTTNLQVQAACGYAATCDPSGTTCNGGQPCYIGNTICEGYQTTYSNCHCTSPYGTSNCTGSGSNAGNTGSSCGGDAYHAAGVCSCTISQGNCNNSSCQDTYWSTCGGGSCGYTAWSACSVGCGPGQQTRTNTCNGTIQTQSCNLGVCATPSPGSGTTCNFGAWSSCSAGCGGGTQSRSDNCGNTQTQACNTQECPCTVSAWSACSATCGTGVQSRSNSCVSGGVEYQGCDTCTLGCACTASCGQSTACGTCASTDLGTPGTIVLTPSSGNYTMPSNRSVTLSWTASTGAENYDVQVYPTGTTAGQECLAANTFCSTAQVGTTFTFTAPAGVPNYSWRVKPNNTTCNAVNYITATSDDNYLISEGAAYDQVAGMAVDGDDATAWNAGGNPTHWIELDLQGTRTISGIRMATSQFPDGSTTFNIYAGATAAPTTLIDSVTQVVTSGDILTLTFSSPVSNVRYIRITTTANPGWVGWAELTPYYSDGEGSWTNGTFTLVGQMSGNFYLDESFGASLNLATGLCELAGSPAGQDPGAGSTIQANWQGGGSANGIIAGSAYTIDNVVNYNNISSELSPDYTQWKCTCPAGCTYSGQNIPLSGVNYYLASADHAWWQTINGLVYAGSSTGNAIVSLVPTACTGPLCVPALSIRNAIAASGSSGIAITGGGDIDADADTSLRYDTLREEPTQGHVIGSIYDGPRENYQYFYNLYSMGSSPTVDFDGTKPTGAPANGRAYFASGDVTINDPIQVNGNESMVIFVSGNLNINNTIHVAEGGFLSFIVNGNITVANTVGNDLASNNTPNVEGVYIADRITINGGLAGGDKKFVGAGTFVGWTNVTMNRAYSDPFTNDSYPTELFVFRPDLVQNVPDRMTRPIYSWQETN